MQKWVDTISARVWCKQTVSPFVFTNPSFHSDNSREIALMRDRQNIETERKAGHNISRALTSYCHHQHHHFYTYLILGILVIFSVLSTPWYLSPLPNTSNFLHLREFHHHRHLSFLIQVLTHLSSCRYNPSSSKLSPPLLDRHHYCCHHWCEEWSVRTYQYRTRYINIQNKAHSWYKTRWTQCFHCATAAPPSV